MVSNTVICCQLTSIGCGLRSVSCIYQCIGCQTIGCVCVALFAYFADALFVCFSFIVCIMYYGELIRNWCSIFFQLCLIIGNCTSFGILSIVDACQLSNNAFALYWISSLMFLLLVYLFYCLFKVSSNCFTM